MNTLSTEHSCWSSSWTRTPQRSKATFQTNQDSQSREATTYISEQKGLFSEETVQCTLHREVLVGFVLVGIALQMYRRAERLLSRRIGSLYVKRAMKSVLRRHRYIYIYWRDESGGGLYSEGRALCTVEKSWEVHCYVVVQHPASTPSAPSGSLCLALATARQVYGTIHLQSKKKIVNY